MQTSAVTKVLSTNLGRIWLGGAWMLGHWRPGRLQWFWKWIKLNRKNSIDSTFWNHNYSDENANFYWKRRNWNFWDRVGRDGYRVINFQSFLCCWRLKMGVSVGHFLVSVMSRMPYRGRPPWDTALCRLLPPRVPPVAAFIELEPLPIRLLEVCRVKIKIRS